MSGVCREPGCPNLRPCPTHAEPERRSPSSRTTGRRDWRAIRLHVLHRDGWRCYRCGVDLKTLEPRARQVDHVTDPVHRRTGKHGDLAACCGPCNNSKNGRPASTS